MFRKAGRAMSAAAKRRAVPAAPGCTFDGEVLAGCHQWSELAGELSNGRDAVVNSYHRMTGPHRIADPDDQTAAMHFIATAWAIHLASWGRQERTLRLDGYQESRFTGRTVSSRRS